MIFNAFSIGLHMLTQTQSRTHTLQWSVTVIIDSVSQVECRISSMGEASVRLSSGSDAEVLVTGNLN